MPLDVRGTPTVLAEHLRNDIVRGHFRPGQALVQEDLAARYGVSRSPVREALRQLEAEGLVRYHLNRGAFVAALSAQDIREFYGVRRILERGAIRLAVPKLTDAGLKAARALEAAFRSEKDARSVAGRHNAFHEAIYAASGNAKLLEAISRHYVRLARVPDMERRVAEVLRCSRRDHRALLDACCARSVAAAEAATLAHLDHLEAIMLEGLEPFAEPA